MKACCSGLYLNILLVSYPSIRQLVLQILVDILEATPLGALTGLKNALLYGLIAIVATLIATVITFPLQARRTRAQAHSASLSSSGSTGYNKSPAPSKEEVSYWAGLQAKLIYTVICEFTFFFTKRCLEIVLNSFSIRM